MNEVTKFQPPKPLKTAILFLVFNRLDTTKKVFKAIRQAKPPRLYIAADGARANKKGECKNVQLVRDYIMQNVDWDCDVKTLFRDKNLGCKYAVGGAITWFFETEEQGIILEDDCLPSQSFFWYCEELLDRYKEDKSLQKPRRLRFLLYMENPKYFLGLQLIPLQQVQRSTFLPRTQFHEVLKKYFRSYNYV